MITIIVWATAFAIGTLVVWAFTYSPSDEVLTQPSAATGEPRPKL